MIPVVIPAVHPYVNQPAALKKLLLGIYRLVGAPLLVGLTTALSFAQYYKLNLEAYVKRDWNIINDPVFGINSNKV